MERRSNRRNVRSVVLKNVIPKRIIRLRALRGYSQAKLASVSGVPRSTIAAIETGQAKNIKITTLQKLWTALVVSPNYLFGIEPDDGLVPAFVASARRTVVAHRTVVEVRCNRCEHVLRQGEPHMQGECIMFAHAAGRSVEYLAAGYGFGMAVIDVILADEYHRLCQRRRFQPLPLPQKSGRKTPFPATRKSTLSPGGAVSVGID